MREVGKFKMRCPNCDNVHWIASKTTSHMDDDGAYFTMRYRKCMDCGYKCKTIQYSGYDEILYEGNIRENKKRTKITITNESTGDTLTTDWSIHDSYKAFIEFFGKKGE
jgi:hypothetical protein